MLDHYNMSIHINTATAQVLVEQRKKNGVISRKNISSQSLSECFLTSRVDDERHDTGLLPEGCIAVVMEKKFTYYFIRYPELYADFRYFDTEYRHFPIPRLVFGFKYMLDDVVGVDGWYNSYKPWHGANKKEAQICGISIYFEERGGFITKWDGAEDSDIEPVKGGLSDSMKRAAVQWGIGRVLYSMTEPVWVNIEPRGRSWIIKKGERPAMDSAYLALLNKLKLQPAAPIGAQSELTPRRAEEPAGNGNPAPPAGQEKSARQPEQKPAPVYDCIVRAAMRQQGMTSVSTMVALDYPNGNGISAYARGEHPDLVPGAKLAGVKLVTRKQDTVVFYVLEEYQVVGAQQAA